MGRGHSPGAIARLLENLGVIVVGMAALIAVFYGAAALDVQTPARHLAEAFDDGTLSPDVARQLEAVPGFVVMESDYEGMCHVYSHMLSPPEALFGLGMRPASAILPVCVAMDEAVHEPLGQAYVPYYRYWQGAAAISKLGLTLMSVYWWQILLTLALAALLVSLVYRLWRYSPTFAVGTAVALFMMADFVWQGMAPLHGISSIVGLALAHLTLTAFSKGWTVRWGIAALGGATYAMVAHTLIPMAFAILVALAAMAPQLRSTGGVAAKTLWAGPVAGLLWVGGYAAGTLSRTLWVAILGPGLETALGEWTGTGGGFFIRSWIDPIYQTLGNLTKTWLDVGFMQVGLMIFALVLGWSLAKGGARGFRVRASWIALSPVLLGFSWLVIWANHTNHTYVHALFALMALNVLFASETGRYSVRAQSIQSRQATSG